MKRFLSAAALAGVLITTAGAAESVYTPTTGRTYRQTTQNSHLSLWQCRGPAGYVAEFGDEGNVVFVAIGFGGHFDERDHEGLIWRGAYKVFGDKLAHQWAADRCDFARLAPRD